ncbi:histone deacetylase [Hyphobacterium sp. CCMP332]|nr:histone deacetylase [Hyphobacterium sp. CCMP332]
MLKIAWSEEYHHPLPKNHRFPMEKYSLIPEQLKYEGTVSDSNFFIPKLLSEKDILAVHYDSYWEKLKKLKLSKSEQRKTGFPLSAELVRRELIITQGTLDCAKYALKFGCAFNVAGGTHHAYRDRGEGFCLLNDVAVASQYLLNSKVLGKILVVDLDVHQGNGTAKIFENEERVFTFSIHGEKNYPMKKEESDLDIELADGTGDREYLKALKENLPKLIDSVQPEIIFFQSGVDILSTDKLGRLGLSKEGCRQRDKYVFEQAKSNDIPIVVTMGGGYSEKISDIVDAHANTYRLAQEIYF